MIGSCKLFLDKETEMLKEQKEINEDFQLDRKSGQPAGFLNCSLLWIYSKVKLFQDYKVEIAVHLAQIEKDKEKYVRLLNILKRAPFVKEDKCFNNNIIDIKSLNENVSQFIDQQTTSIALKLYPNMTPKWEVICFYSILGYMALSTAVMMYRPDFINVMLYSVASCIMYCAGP
jgi:hypothetical protein